MDVRTCQPKSSYMWPSLASNSKGIAVELLHQAAGVAVISDEIIVLPVRERAERLLAQLTSNGDDVFVVQDVPYGPLLAAVVQQSHQPLGVFCFLSSLMLFSCHNMYSSNSEIGGR
jgi:hypothetical protein